MAKPTHPDEIYVGYLPVPPRQYRFLRWMVPASLWVLCAVTFLWARSQHSPGTGIWDQGQPSQFHGMLIARPYPILFTMSDSGESEAILLVEVGKHGGAQRAASLDGRRVTVTGWPLHRDGRRVLELEPAESSIAPDAGSPVVTAAPVQTPLGTATLRGEIVDSKCFLGAMKPGEGKAHKDCATLCIRGGIPPMFVTQDDQGENTYILLTAPDGGPLDAAAHPFIADPVEITGEWADWGGLRVLRLRPENIRRL